MNLTELGLSCRMRRQSIFSIFDIGMIVLKEHACYCLLIICGGALLPASAEESNIPVVRDLSLPHYGSIDAKRTTSTDSSLDQSQARWRDRSADSGSSVPDEGTRRDQGQEGRGYEANPPSSVGAVPMRLPGFESQTPYSGDPEFVPRHDVPAPNSASQSTPSAPAGTGDTRRYPNERSWGDIGPDPRFDNAPIPATGYPHYPPVTVVDQVPGAWPKTGVAAMGYRAPPPGYVWIPMFIPNPAMLPDGYPFIRDEYVPPPAPDWPAARRGDVLADTPDDFWRDYLSLPQTEWSIPPGSTYYQ